MGLIPNLKTRDTYYGFGSTPLRQIKVRTFATCYDL
jgi:hypothetical protein